MLGATNSNATGEAGTTDEGGQAGIRHGVGSACLESVDCLKGAAVS